MIEAEQLTQIYRQHNGIPGTDEYSGDSFTVFSLLAKILYTGIIDIQKNPILAVIPNKLKVGAID